MLSLEPTETYKSSYGFIHGLLSSILKVPSLLVGNTVDLLTLGFTKTLLPSTENYMNHAFFKPYFRNDKNSYSATSRLTHEGFAGLFSAATSTLLELPIKAVAAPIALVLTAISFVISLLAVASILLGGLIYANFTEKDPCPNMLR